MTEAGRTFEETERVEDVIADADVLYVTRVQKERFADLREYEAVKDYYEITPELMARAKEQMAVMHPLPRVGEIHYDVDDDPRATYFRQMENGMYIRAWPSTAVLGKASASWQTPSGSASAPRSPDATAWCVGPDPTPAASPPGTTSGGVLVRHRATADVAAV